MLDLVGFGNVEFAVESVIAAIRACVHEGALLCVSYVWCKTVSVCVPVRVSVCTYMSISYCVCACVLKRA